MNYFLSMILFFFFLVAFICALVNFFSFFTKLFFKKKFYEKALIKFVLWFALSGFTIVFVTENAEWFDIKVQRSNPPAQQQKK